MRGNGVGYWIDLFKDMVDEGVFSTADPLHIECVRFCFKGLLESELTQIRIDWNQHLIRPSRQAAFEGGKPDLLYFTPEIFADRKLAVNPIDILAVREMYEEMQPPAENQDFQEMCRNLLHRDGKAQPSDPPEAKDLLIWLVQQYLD